ncbi:MAG: DNA polymerase III subunit beta [Proteobacteria bacterium]|nr:DNA polymerase III subunit beta [Pseudomonadota bacterium]
MKFYVEKSVFLKALGHGQSVVEKKTTVPILSHLLLKAEDNKITLISTDFDLSLVEEIPAKIDVNGSVCVQAHILFDIVRKLSERSLIEIEANPNSNQIIIRSGRSKFELSYIMADEFPQITKTELTHRFSLPSKTLKEMITKTESSMSTDEARYNVCGIFMHCLAIGGELRMRSVATDYHRMACVEVEAPDAADSMPNIIIGKKAVFEMKKILDIASENVDIALSENRIELTVEKGGYKAVLSSRLVEGTFPDYQTALTFHQDKTLIVAREDFMGAVDRVGTVVSQNIRAIKIKLLNNLATLSVVSPELGSAVEEMDVDFPFEMDVELCVNVKYLLDVTQIIEEDEIEFLIDNADSSVVIRGLGNQRSMFVLMPLTV